MHSSTTTSCLKHWVIAPYRTELCKVGTGIKNVRVSTTDALRSGRSLSVHRDVSDHN
jgi:hypothetical protein